MPYKDKAQKQAYQAQWWAGARRSAARKARQDWVDEQKNRPCADCGVSYPPCVMDFDHLEDDKVMNVSVAIRTVGWEKLRAEVAKCEVVCSNCHRLRTWKRHHDGISQLAEEVGLNPIQ